MSMNPAAHEAVFSLFSGSLTADDAWLIIGFLAQGLFFARFLVQWIASEKSGKSVIPDVFWYFSLSVQQWVGSWLAGQMELP